MPKKYTEKLKKTVALRYTTTNEFASEVAERFGVSKTSVLNWTKEFDLHGKSGREWAMEEMSRRPYRNMKEKKGDLIESMYKAGRSIESIQAVTGYSIGQISRYLDFYDLKESQSERLKKHFNSKETAKGKERRKKIRKVGRTYAKWRDIKSVEQIAQKFDECIRTIRSWLKSNLNPYPYTGNEHKLSDEERKEIQDLIKKEDYSQTDIAKEYDVSQSTISRIVS